MTAPDIIPYFDDFEGPNPYGFLSNFYARRFRLGGVSYPTGEHAFQAFKTTHPEDRELIRKAASPGLAKRYGRQVVLRPDWEKMKYDVMRQVLRAKFAPGGQLADKLLSTGDAMLIEGTDWNDTVWGVRRKTMVGRNWLGHLLMARRAELRSEYEPDHTWAMAFITPEAL